MAINLTITAVTPEELKVQIASLADVFGVRKRGRRTTEQVAADEAEARIAEEEARYAGDPSNETRPSPTGALPPTQPEAPAPATTPIVYPTLEEVRAVLGAAAAKHGRDAVFSTLKSFGTNKISELAEDKRPNLLTAIAKLDG